MKMSIVNGMLHQTLYLVPYGILCHCGDIENDPSHKELHRNVIPTYFELIQMPTIKTNYGLVMHSKKLVMKCSQMIGNLDGKSLSK